jgi:hypothetical protein
VPALHGELQENLQDERAGLQHQRRWLVPGEPTFDNERRRLEKHAEGKKSGEAKESEGDSGDEVAIRDSRALDVIP